MKKGEHDSVYCLITHNIINKIVFNSFLERRIDIIRNNNVFHEWLLTSNETVMECYKIISPTIKYFLKISSTRFIVKYEDNDTTSVKRRMCNYRSNWREQNEP